MYLDIQKHGKTPVGVFRESYREDGKVKKRELGRVRTELHVLEQIRETLRGNTIPTENVDLTNAREYGASQALFDLIKDIGMDKDIYPNTYYSWVKLVYGMIIGRILYQGSKLSLSRISRFSNMWEMLGCQELASNPDNLYEAMDELLKRQDLIQGKLFQRHYDNENIILYDITSSYLEGDYKKSSLVAYGYNRDKKKGHPQIVIGLICNKEGCPLAVKVFSGNTKDDHTVQGQIEKLINDYKVKNMIFVGDRGMLNGEGLEAYEELDLGDSTVQYVTALTHSDLRKLCETKNINKNSVSKGPVEYTWDKYEGRRIVVSYNPKRAAEDQAKRRILVEKTAQELEAVANKKRPVNDAKVGERVGGVINKYKAKKFFNYEIKDGKLYWEINQEKIESEELYDGLYAVITDTDEHTLSVEGIISTYRKLSGVEQAFKNLKGPTLSIRPIYHKTDERIESHVFICMLAYYLEWHMIQRLKPLMDENKSGYGWENTLESVIEELKTLVMVDVEMSGVIANIKISPNKRQEKLLKLLKGEKL